MSDIRIQKLELTNCEDKIERNYYDWGRERSKAGWADPTWENATTEQKRAVSLRGYALYDGCPAPQGNDITAAEIWATVGFRSRIVELDAVRILARANKVPPLLARIPDDARLEDATADQIAAAGEIVRTLKAHQVNVAKITKMLHKKRPAFMPALDSVVFDFLCKNFPHIVKQASSLEDLLHLCQSILRTYIGPIQKIRAYLADRGFPLSNARVLDWILWIGWKRPVDSYGFGKPIVRIWGTSSLAEARAKAQEQWEATLESFHGAPC